MKNTRKTLMIVFALLLVLVLSFTLIACNKDDDNNKNTGDDGDGTGVNTIADDDFELTLVGILDEDVVITKAQLKELYKTKPIEIEAFDPVKYADASNKLYKTKINVKGVYLDDVIEAFVDTTDRTSDFIVIHAYSSDGYNMMYSQPMFAEEKGGAKILVALEYGGETLDDTNYYMRAVLNEQAQNTWIKFLNKFTFSKNPVSAPDPKRVYFIESLLMDTSLWGTFDRAKIEGDESVVYTYKGLDMTKLASVAKKILSPAPDDMMYLSAWDFMDASGVNDDQYAHYTGWLISAIYKEGMIVMKEWKKGTAEPSGYEITSPAFDSPEIPAGSGMKVKNLIALSVGWDALFSIDIALARYGIEDGDITYITVDCILDEIIADDMLTGEALSKDIDGKSIELCSIGNTKVTITAEQFKAARIYVDEDGDYVISYNNGSNNIMQIKSFEIK